MKKLIVFFLILLPCLSSAQSSDIVTYRLAVEAIKNTYAFENYNRQSGKGVQVMAQLIPLSHMGEPFYKELMRETGTDYNLDENWGSIRKNRNLSSLSDVSRSDLKLFFSKIDKNTFLAELISGSKYKDWEKATLNSTSTIFLLSYNDNKVLIIDSLEQDD